MRPYIYSIALAFASFWIQSKQCDAFEYLSSLTEDSAVDSLSLIDFIEYGTDTAVSRCLSQYSDPAIDSFFESEENYIRLVIFPIHAPFIDCPRILWIGMPKNDTSRVLGIIKNTVIDTCIIGLTGKYERLTSVFKHQNNRLFSITGIAFHSTLVTHYVNRTRTRSVHYSGVWAKVLVYDDIDWCTNIISPPQTREAISVYVAFLEDLRTIFR